MLKLEEMNEMKRFEDIYEAIEYENSISKKYHTTMRKRDGLYVIFGKKKVFGIF